MVERAPAFLFGVFLSSRETRKSTFPPPSLLSLVEIPCFDESADLLLRVPVIVLLLALIERDELLGAVDHGFDVDVAVCQPRRKPLDLNQAWISGLLRFHYNTLPHTLLRAAL